MHKVIKRTIKYTGGILLLLVIVLIGGISYLYFSADMMTPPKEPNIILTEVPYADTIALVPAEVLYKDTLDLDIMLITLCDAVKADCGNCS